jgi:hypothetical protein
MQNPTTATSPPAARPQANYQYARQAGIRTAAEILVKRGFTPATVRAMDRPWSAEVADAMEQQTAARPLCLADKSFGRVHWTCTEPLGHDGPHEATADDGGIFAVWPREDVDAVLVPPAPYSLPAIELTGGAS